MDTLPWQENGAGWGDSRVSSGGGTLSIFRILKEIGNKRRKELFTVELHACLVTLSCPTLCDPMDCSPPGSSVHGDSPGMNTEVSCHVHFQGIFPTQGSNPGLPHCRQILYHLSFQGNPGELYDQIYILERFLLLLYGERIEGRLEWQFEDQIVLWERRVARMRVGGWGQCIGREVDKFKMHLGSRTT